MTAMTRKQNDAYFTPQPLADAIVGRCVSEQVIVPGDVVLEPSAGRGAFVEALNRHGIAPDVVDLDLLGLPASARVSRSHEGDFLDHAGAPPWVTSGYDAIIGNPPFSQAEAHVRRALDLIGPSGAVVFLLRLAFLEGQRRAGFWATLPAERVWVLSRRPSFTGGGTDSAAYGVFIWRGTSLRGQQETVMSHLAWGHKAVSGG